MTLEIAYRYRYTGEWYTMPESTVGERSIADMYALVINGNRSFQNESLVKVQTVQRKILHTAQLLELSQIA